MSISGQELLTGVSIQDLAELADINPSLRGYLHGYLAEMFLQRQLLEIEGVTSVEKIPDRAKLKGDFKVVYLGKTITIEVKSLSSRSIKEDLLNGGWTGSVGLKRTDAELVTSDGERTCCLTKGEFDILAICNFSLTRDWDFQFIANKYLPSSDLYSDRLTTKFIVNTLNTPKLTSDITEVFAEF